MADDARDVVHQFYAALGRGDAPAALGLLSPDIAWTEAEHSPYYAGTLHGVEAVVAKVLEPINADFDDFAAVTFDFLSQDGRVAAFGNYSGKARKTGRQLLTPFVHLWEVSNGRIHRFTQFTDSGLWNKALRD
jgi:uncharacterized protein